MTQIALLLLCVAQVESVQLDDQAQIDSQFSPSSIDLGEIVAGREHRFVLEFLNGSGSDLKITKVETSCGCLAATRKVPIVKNGTSSELLVVLTPTNTLGEFGKALAVQFESGNRWPINVRAKILPRVVCEPDEIRLPHQAKGQLKFKVVDGTKTKKLSVRSLTGNIKFGDVAEAQAGELSANYWISKDDTRTPVTHIERIAVYDSDYLLAIVQLPLRPTAQLQLRPKSLYIRKGNGSSVADFIIIGSPHLIKSAAAESLEFIFDEQSNSVRVPVKVLQRSRSLIKARIELEEDCDVSEASAGTLVDSSGRELCRCESIEILD